MADETRTAAATLNELIETCRDGANGYRAAAGAVTESSLKATFTQFATQRDQFATELQGLMSKVGGGTAPEESGSVLGAVHRGWLAAKGWVVDLVTGHDEATVLAECERGDEYACHQSPKFSATTSSPTERDPFTSTTSPGRMRSSKWCGNSAPIT